MVAKIAMKAAEEDVNSDPAVLGGTKLAISMHDSNYSGFLGILGGNFFLPRSFSGSITLVFAGPYSHDF